MVWVFLWRFFWFGGWRLNFSFARGGGERQSWLCFCFGLSVKWVIPHRGFNLYFPNYIEHLLSVYLPLILIMLSISYGFICHSYNFFRKMAVQIFYLLYYFLIIEFEILYCLETSLLSDMLSANIVNGLSFILFTVSFTE